MNGDLECTRVPIRTIPVEIQTTTNHTIGY